MNTKNENKNKPVPALMRKTKAQLIDIILRKDDIERGLRNDIKGMENTLNEYKKQLDSANRQIEVKNKAYDELNADFESTCDENASTICDLKETIKEDKTIIISLCAGIITGFTIICLWIF